MSLQRALQDAKEAALGVLHPGALDRALAALGAPRRIAALGRTSSGKSTLIRRLASVPAGEREPMVGLGGVTRAAIEIPRGDVIWVDTPGIDDPDAAILSLAQQAESADILLWVVDALQPMTRSERTVLERIVLPKTPLWVVVAKLDLIEEEERPSVIERVRAISAPFSPIGLAAGDNRTAIGPELPPELPIGPARRGQIRKEIEATELALRSLPPLTDPEALLALLRGQVRAWVHQIGAQIASGEIGHEEDVREALRQKVAAFSAEIARGPAPAPKIPLLPVQGPSGRILAGLAGSGGARRALQTIAGRWLLEGEAAIADWPKAPQIKRLSAERTRLQTLLIAASSELEP